MVENNERGRLVRRYFIWAEDVARRLATGELLTEENRAIIGGIASGVSPHSGRNLETGKALRIRNSLGVAASLPRRWAP
jgi:hypothetical protein